MNKFEIKVLYEDQFVQEYLLIFDYMQNSYYIKNKENFYDYNFDNRTINTFYSLPYLPPDPAKLFRYDLLLKAGAKLYNKFNCIKDLKIDIYLYDDYEDPLKNLLLNSILSASILYSLSELQLIDKYMNSIFKNIQLLIINHNDYFYSNKIENCEELERILQKYEYNFKNNDCIGEQQYYFSGKYLKKLMK